MNGCSQELRSPMRRGTVLIVVIVSLVVVLATLMALVRLAGSHRGAIESQSLRLQARWLARSGAERAVARLAADAKYSGETWNVTAGDLGAADAARVEIRIEAVAGHPQRRAVRVQADFPAEGLQRVRSTWQHDMDLPAPAAKPIEKPAASPAEKTGAKPETKTIPAPSAKPAEKTSGKL
jgi:Tfp pilus assembly protein PilV